MDVQGGNATAYTLALAAASLPVSGGLTLATAQALGTLGTAPVALNGWVGPIETAAWYSFTLVGATTLTLQLSAWVSMLGGSAGLSLLDSGGNQIALATTGAANAASLVRALAGGRYYVLVTQASPSTSATYTLNLTSALPATGAPGASAYGTAAGNAWLVRSAPAGTYIVDVNDYSGDTNYVLTLSASPTWLIRTARRTDTGRRRV